MKHIHLVYFKNNYSNYCRAFMEISVIIPTYKPQKYILRCLDSLKKQTFERNNFEVLIILNGDKDPFYSMISSFLSDNFDGIHYKLIYSEIPGVSNARNIGIERSSGNFIVFLDDDDFLSEDYLAELYQNRQEQGIVFSDTNSFEETDNNQISFFGDSYHQVYEDNYLKTKQTFLFKIRRLFNVPWMKLISREVIGDTRFDLGLNNGEDTLFMFAISSRVKAFGFADKKACYYRCIRQNSASLNKKKLSYVRNNRKVLIIKMVKIFFSDIKNYNFIFLLSMCLACLKVIVISDIKALLGKSDFRM